MLPGPNFNGPTVIAAAPAPPVETPKPTPRVRIATVRPPVAPPGNVPAAWIPQRDAPYREWDWIVIHHSAGEQGGAKSFDKYHREVKGWDELGYHFVIGNGSETADGLVEVGPRWPVQKHGAHAKTPDNMYNEHGIGICLVGNMDNHKPTAKQMAALVKLVAFLADRYHVPQGRIIGHKQTGKDTDCPGAMTDINEIRRQVGRARTAVAEEPPHKPGDELVQSLSR